MIHACSSQSTHMRNTWQNKVTALVEHDCVIQRGRRVAGIRSRPVRHEFVHTLCHAPVVHVSDTRIAAEWPRCVFDECGADVEVCSDVTDGHVVRQALLHHALPHVLRERQRHRRASGAEEQMLESAERTYVRQRVCTRCCKRVYSCIDTIPFVSIPLASLCLPGTDDLWGFDARARMIVSMRSSPERK